MSRAPSFTTKRTGRLNNAGPSPKRFLSFSFFVSQEGDRDSSNFATALAPLSADSQEGLGARFHCRRPDSEFPSSKLGRRVASYFSTTLTPSFRIEAKFGTGHPIDTWCNFVVAFLVFVFYF